MKKLISILLCVLILLSSVAVSNFSAAVTQPTIKQAIEKYEKESGEKIETNRYFFLMPNGENGIKGTDGYTDSWYNDNADTAGIYWWDTGKVDPDSWPGFKMNKGDSDSVYYADIPDFVEIIIFNNFLDGGMDNTSPIYDDVYQTVNLSTLGYDKDESSTYPEGIDSFEDMIFVIDPEPVVLNGPYVPQYIKGGEWYYYYGNGCYGTVKDGNESNCICDFHDHENLVIHFDPSNTGWTDYENIYCVFDPGRGPCYPNLSVPALCTDYDGDGIYTYDLNKSKIKLSKYNRYTIYFSNEKWEYTCDLTMQTTNLKDTVYTTGEIQEHYKKPIIKWKNEIPVELRPVPTLKDTVAKYEKETGEKLETNRYYFLMPNGESGKKGDIYAYTTNYNGKYAENWYNDYADTAGVYWNSNYNLNPDRIAGYLMEKADSEGIFYADVPTSVKILNFTNGVDASFCVDGVTKYFGRITQYVLTYPSKSSRNSYLSTVENFDNMICVINPAINSDMSMIYPTEYGCEWYYYYGDGCYGEVKDGDKNDCKRDDHEHGLKTICREEFLDLCKIAEDDNYNYSGPLYYHYEDEKTEPSWFLALGNTNTFEYTGGCGVFDDYIFNIGTIGSPSPFSYYIYMYDEGKFYTLEDAWDKGFVDKEKVFTEYLYSHDAVTVFGDCDFDNILSVIDATKIQQAEAGMIKLYDRFDLNILYGDKFTYSTDVDKDGVRSVMDATAIQIKLAQLD